MTIESRRVRSIFMPTPADAARIVASAVQAFVVARKRRRDVRRLADMPEYMLKDIGLKRDDVCDALNTDWRADPTFKLAVAAARRRRDTLG